MNALQIKTAIMCHYRFKLSNKKNRFKYVATEVGSFSADVIAMSDNEVHEIEVKISHKDLLMDFNKGKHDQYSGKRGVGWKRGLWVPNYFYFATIPSLEGSALHTLEDWPDYGLYICSPSSWPKHQMEVKKVKKAKLLNNKPPKPAVIEQMLCRMSSEICGLHLKKIFEENSIKEVSKYFDKLARRETVCTQNLI